MADAAHAPGDIWHRSLEDLLKAIETAEARAASSISFAITLQVSTTPIGMPTAAFPRFDKLHVYQLRQVASDNLPRFQLRLGIIESDLEADAILSSVRQYYPGAIKGIIGEADRTAIAQVLRLPQNKPSVPPVAKLSPLPAVAPTKAVAPAPSTKIEAGVEPRWNIDELLPNLANPGPLKRPRPTRAGASSRIPPQSRSLAMPVRLADARVVRLEATVQAVEPTVAAVPAPAPVAPPVAPKAPAAPKPAELLAAGRAKALPATSLADTGTLQSLVAKIETLIDAVETHAETTAAPRPTAAPAPAAAVAPPAAAAVTLPAVGLIRAAAPAQASASASPAAVTPAPPAATAPAQATTAPAKVAPPATVTPAPPTAHALASGPSVFKSLPPRPPPAQASARSIDSTQTIRALTDVELSDAASSQWFVIQLMQSQELIDPEQIPQLDIFSEYRLYSVCEPDQTPGTHALRLGFFSSEIAAQAVAGYLRSHFPSTHITRVSIAERDRFADQVVVAKKDVGEAGKHTVIEFSPAPAALEPAIAPAAAPNQADRRSSAPSLWSRLTRLRGA